MDGQAAGGALPEPVPLAHGSRHGQCLRWDARGGRWWWADSAAGLVRAWPPRADAVLSCKAPYAAAAFAHCRSGLLLLGLAKRLCLAMPPAQGAGVQRLQMRALTAVDPAEPRTSIHDGRTDRRGFFVFGTRNESADARAIGSFYQYSRQYGLRRLALPTVAVANSICFSLDGSQLYFADSAGASILQCDYDALKARVANIRPFALMDKGAAPGGAVVDRDGNLWSAQAGAGRLIQYAPDGSVLRRIAIPEAGPTCPAFGGDALDQLVVSSAHGLFAVPGSGATGVDDTLFDDQDLPETPQ